MSSNEPNKNSSGEQERAEEQTREEPSREARPAQATSNYGSILPAQRISTQQASGQGLRVPDSPVPLSEPPLNTPASPPTLVKSKKPAVMRRASTKKQLPQRGQEFSVDDDPSELEADHQPPTPQSASISQGRRPESTVRRRTAAQITPLPRLDSDEEDQDLTISKAQSRETVPEIGEQEPVNDQDVVNEDTSDGDDGDVSDAESFTLRDRQLAINQTHPFGIRIWKPALYKKNRSVEKTAEEDIHSSPSAGVSAWLWLFNVLWTLLFGWWLAIACLLSALVCLLFALEPTAWEYSKIFWGLARYLFFPFGQFVQLESDENYADEDEGEGRSISEYERWQTGDLEHGRLFFGPTQTTSSIVGRRRNSLDSANEQDSLLGRPGRQDPNDTNASRYKRRIFGRGQWTLGRVVFYGLFYFFVAPLMLLASGACWMMVFWIPMARVVSILFSHLRRHPLALSFHPDARFCRSSTSPSSILLCTYRAVGSKYWKYTVDGTNVFLINLLGIVAFVIVDYFILAAALGLKFWLTSPALLFGLALLSVIPLAYFIGQAVASISAQSSMGMGAAVNAFFSTIVEVYLYCVALNEGRGKLVEGSIIGSIFAGILFLPGLSMCFGAIKRKTQRFNVKSAGATSTMLLFAVIAAFGPTLFYKIYGSHELVCYSCSGTDDLASEPERDCRRCYFRQTPELSDPFFVEAVRPYCWFAAVMLFFSYIIGLLFTLRTHAAVIWTTDLDEKRPGPTPTAEASPLETRRQSIAHGPNVLAPARSPSYISGNSIRNTALYKRILGQSLNQVGLRAHDMDQASDSTVGYKGPQTGQSQETEAGRAGEADTPHVVPPKSRTGENGVLNIPGMPHLSEEENRHLATYVAEVAATAAAVAARDATKTPRFASFQGKISRPQSIRHGHGGEAHHTSAGTEPTTHNSAAGGGHDAPNWSRTKSSIILCTATVAYALVAEVLVNTVDVVLQSVDIDEKFLGITLFALVPNTTEFLNAISFAMNGNIALSMEIGSAYALQVCLLQIPALVLFSAVHGRFIDPSDLIDHTFSLIFPQFDMVTVILCVFLLSYMYGEGKSNYFKGGILILAYLVVIMGFYYSGYTRFDMTGVVPTDTLAMMSSPGMSAMGAGRLPSMSHKEL